MSLAVASVIGPTAGCEDDALFIDEMAYEKPEYSRTDVKKAGAALAGVIPESALRSDPEALIRWFRIAHNWRASHIVPLRAIHAELSRKAAVHGGLTAARLKRMQSLRKKLKARSLNGIQDIAGCRVICPSTSVLAGILSDYHSGKTRYLIDGEDDYIVAPRPSGYRSHHLKMRYQGTGELAAYDGLRVEIQLRTKLQHAWATAVEAVGLFRGEDLKGGAGDPRWLRFLQLMASEAAVSEGTAIVPGTPDNARERRQEIRDINDDIHAVETLDGFRSAIRGAESIPVGAARHFLVQYDSVSRAVSVRAFNMMSEGAAAYDANDLINAPADAVLVEVGRVEDLKSAFPNYFLDVALFTAGLRRVMSGGDFGSVAGQARQGVSQISTFLKDWQNPTKK